MKIVSDVHFILEMVEPAEREYKERIRYESYDAFISLQSEIDHIGLLREVPCAFNLMRQVSFRTEDYYILKQKNGEDITTDSFKFIVADKVPYLADLQQYLLKNFSRGTKPCQEVHFKNFAQFDIKKPIFFTGPWKYNKSFLPDKPLNERPLMARPLTNQDIVLDKKLNQIWPVATNKPPKELVDLLARNKEKIYEG